MNYIFNWPKTRIDAIWIKVPNRGGVMTGRSIKVMLTICLGMFQLSFWPQAQSQQCLTGDIRLDTGYRWDKINNRVSLFGEDFGARVSSQTINHVNSFQLGSTGHLAYRDWFVKGTFHYGWIGSGNYNEGGFKGKIHGHTLDASASLGYLFKVYHCIWVAPLVGWSYDDLHMKTKRARVTISGVTLNVGDIKCHNRFEGPWVGTDIVFQPSPCYQVVLGHEFHYAHWRGTRILSSGELGLLFGTTTGFSNVRKHDHLWGQVFRIDVSYISCHAWDFGFGLKYQNWNAAGNGRYKRTKVPVDPTITAKRVTDVDWESFGVTLHASYMF